MAIWLTKDSKVIVQGMTGSEGSKHTRRMLAAGTNVVGGVSPARGASTSTSTAPRCRCSTRSPTRWPQTGADVTVIFVPPQFAKAAVVEAIDAGIDARRRDHRGHAGARHRPRSGRTTSRTASKTRIIGPNCPGIASPGASNAGIIPADITPAPAGSAWSSKSGTLTYQMMYELRDIGFSTCVGIGGDPIIGTTHIDALDAFQDDPETDAIVMIGEIGGDAEERAAEFIKANVTKPVVGYIAGFTAPEGKTMGHAGAIISGSAGHRRREEGGAGGGRRQGRQDAERDRASSCARSCAAFRSRASPNRNTERIDDERPVMHDRPLVV